LQSLRRHELPAPTASQATLEVLELFGEMLLLKQPLAPLMIYNVSMRKMLCFNQLMPMPHACQHQVLQPSRLCLCCGWLTACSCKGTLAASALCVHPGAAPGAAGQQQPRVADANALRRCWLLC
jgi:hypothetical protein